MLETVVFVIVFAFLLIYPKYIFTSKLAVNFLRLHSKHAKIDWKEHIRSVIPYENNCFIAELLDVKILAKVSRIFGVLFVCAAVNTIVMRSVLNSGNDFYIFITTTLNALIIVISFALDIIMAFICCKLLDKKGYFLFAVVSPLCFFMLTNGLNKFFTDNKDTLLGTYAEDQF
jgi:hypothetical protein